MTRATDPRLNLLRAAEKLFTERGIDRVSLREIAAAAGQRNHSAAQYHFETKRELIEALLERHSTPIQASWFRAFRELDTRRSGLRDLIELLVRSIAAKLDDADGGRAYLEICSQLVAHPEMPLVSMRVATTPAAAEFGRRLRALAPVSTALFPLHALRLVAALHCSIADYARLREAKLLRVSRETFTLDLITALTGLVSGAGERPGKVLESRPRRKARKSK